MNEGNIWRLTDVSNRSVKSGIARGKLAKGPLSLYSHCMEHAVGNTALEHWFPNSGADSLHRPQAPKLPLPHSRHFNILDTLGPCKVCFHLRAFAFAIPSPEHAFPIYPQVSLSHFLQVKCQQGCTWPPNRKQPPTPTWGSLPSKTCFILIHRTCYHVTVCILACLSVHCLSPLLEGKRHENKVLSVVLLNIAVFPGIRIWWCLMHVFQWRKEGGNQL